LRRKNKLRGQTNPIPVTGLPPGVVRLDYRSRFDGQPDWALAWTPPRGNDWLVCLHGHGSGGSQLYVRPDLREHWLPAFRKLGLGILTPNLRGNNWMGPAAADDLADLLERLRSEFGAGRFFFFSGSMGGTGNLIYAIRRPGDAAALVALAPAADLTSYHAWCRRGNRAILREIADAIEKAYGGSPDGRPAAYRRHSALEHHEKLVMPTFIAHGREDAVIPVEQSRRLAEKRGGDAGFVYREIEGGHDAPLLLPEAVEWLADLVSRKEKRC